MANQYLAVVQQLGVALGRTVGVLDENGVVVAGRRSSPAYAPAFIDAVKAQTGDRYVRP